MEWRWSKNSWLSRGELPGDFFDLAVSAEAGDAPPEAAARRLADAPVDSLFRRAVDATIEARMAALGWREGPAFEDWSLVELRIDRGGALWATAHEYETDEYSAWMVRFDAADQPVEVRRRADGPLDGEPGEAGTAIG